MSSIVEKKSSERTSPVFGEEQTSRTHSDNAIQKIVSSIFTSFNPISGSPISALELSSHISPLSASPIPILKKEGFSKVTNQIKFEELLVKETREFEREDHEYWDLFSLDCAHFPEITSEEEARQRLAKYSQDLYVSPFIPKNSEMTASKKLDATYETIKRSTKSDILIWFCCLYLIRIIKESPEIYDEMAILLQNNPDESTNARDVFWDTYEASFKQGILCDFVESLDSLIPLTEMAKLRLAADSIAIVNSSFQKLIVKWEVKNYEMLEAQMESLGKWLDKPGHSFKVLNLLNINIEVLPPQLLPYFRSVRKLELGTNYDNIPDAIFRDHLPNVSYLTLSYTAFDEQFSYNFLQTLTVMKALREIDLSSGRLDLEEIPDLADYCIKNKIELILPIPNSERDLILLMERLGLVLPERSEAANLRCLSAGLKIYNQAQYRALLEHMKTPDNLAVLNSLTELDLSDLSIDTLPEDIRELTGITKVILKRIQVSSSKISQMIETILTLPHLKCIELSNDADKMAFDPFIDQCNQKGIMFLCPYSEEEENLISFLERLKEANPDLNIPDDYADAQDLLNQILSQKEALDNLGILDFSRTNIDALPLSLSKSFSNVRKLILQGVYPERANVSRVFNSLLQLPKLESIDLSGNFISPAIFATLSYLVTNPTSKIKTITLLECDFYTEDLATFDLLCKDMNVRLIV